MSLEGGGGGMGIGLNQILINYIPMLYLSIFLESQSNGHNLESTLYQLHVGCMYFFNIKY